MQGAVRFAHFRTSTKQSRIAKKLASLDGVIDAAQILIDDASGTEVHMTNFGVSHLACGQSDMHARGFNQRVRMLCQQGIPVRCSGHRNGIVRRRLAIAPAIQNQQHHGLGTVHRHTPGAGGIGPRIIPKPPICPSADASNH
ncbi:MAG: hypothetical protein BWZ07_01046 [Alphaproteobacteria bacterium ADurb.BinA280]|jgi:hypothetical protein|nr:MAG: hypothetical protein BWZ07_01046 [Alphaproteobacteria bacterium ADurb.BinA280]